MYMISKKLISKDIIPENMDNGNDSACVLSDDIQQTKCHRPILNQSTTYQ